MSPEATPSTVRPVLLAAIAVDDLRLQILEGLPEFGWRLLTASTGNEIPALVAQHGPDALLIDREMADRASGNIHSVGYAFVAQIVLED